MGRKNKFLTTILIIYVTDHSTHDFAAIYVMNVDNGKQNSLNPRQIAGSVEGMCILPAWSPDGRRIAYTTQMPGENRMLWDDDDRMEIWVVAADGSGQVRISDATPEPLVAHWLPVHWFSDGNRQSIQNFLDWIGHRTAVICRFSRYTEAVNWVLCPMLSCGVTTSRLVN